MSCGCGTGTLVGTKPTKELTFTDGDGAGVDPTSITVTILNPDGSTDTYTTPNAAIYQAGSPVAGQWFFTFPDVLPAGTYWGYVVGEGGGGDAAAQFSQVITDTHVPLP